MHYHRHTPSLEHRTAASHGPRPPSQIPDVNQHGTLEEFDSSELTRVQLDAANGGSIDAYRSLIAGTLAAFEDGRASAASGQVRNVEVS